jgi:hypothetical protein
MTLPRSTTDHLIGTGSGVSLAGVAGAVEGADVKSMPVSANGLSSELLEELAALAAEKTAQGGLRLMGEGGILPELAQHLMQAALEAEMELHLAAEAGRVGGRGSRSGGNMRNGYRAKKVMTEVGPVTVQVPRHRLGTFSPRLLPKYARRTGALDEMVLSLTAKRRAHDAVAEVRHLTSRSYEWIVEGDIAACFDEISHPALMERVRRRVGDKRVLALVKAFLKAGILGEDKILRSTDAGTPQGSILSPLLSNVALSVLDEYIAQAPGGPCAKQYQQAKRRRNGLPNYRLIRYADDWCLAVSGTRADAEALREEIAIVLSTMGLRLSREKTLITHIEDGLDFLGWRIQRHRKRGTSKHFVYLYPAKKALRSIMAKVKTVCWQDANLPLDTLLHQLNQVLRGLDRLLQTRFVEGDLQLPAGLYLEAGLWMAPPKAPANQPGSCR